MGKLLCVFVFAEVVVPELTVHWQESYYSASEATGIVEVCAELSTLQFDGNVEANYTTFGNSAEGNIWAITKTKSVTLRITNIKLFIPDM